MLEFERAVLASIRLQLQDDAAFCAAAGKIQGEFLVIHPFREGTARTIEDIRTWSRSDGPARCLV